MTKDCSKQLQILFYMDKCMSSDGALYNNIVHMLYVDQTTCNLCLT